MTCHKCDKKGHIKKDCRSKVNGSGGNPPKNSTNELPEWVTRKPVVLDTKDLKIFTMTCNNKKYKWCISCNNGQGAWLEGWPQGVERKASQEQISSIFRFCHQCSNLLLLPHGHQWELHEGIKQGVVELTLAWEGKILELKSEDKLQPVSQ